MMYTLCNFFVISCESEPNYKYNNKPVCCATVVLIKTWGTETDDKECYWNVASVDTVSDFENFLLLLPKTCCDLMHAHTKNETSRWVSVISLTTPLVPFYITAKLRISAVGGKQNNSLFNHISVKSKYVLPFWNLSHCLFWMERLIVPFMYKDLADKLFQSQ